MLSEEVPMTEESAASDAETVSETVQEEGVEETAAPAEPPITFRDVLRFFRDFLAKYSWAMLLAAAVVLVGYYVLFPSRNVYHSDTTDTLMWAIASNESGTLFNPDFTYACLLPFSTSLIMTALIPIFGVTMTTHVLGMLVFFLLFTGALIWMCRRMNWSWHWTSIMVFLVLMLLSGSEKLREIFWGHTIYYSLGVFFVFVGLALLFRHMDLNARKEKMTAEESFGKINRKLVLSLVLIGVWFLLACTNQLIAIVIFALPIMAAVFCERWLDDSCALLCKKNRQTLLVFGIMGIGTVLGHLLTNVLANGIVAGYESAFSSFSNMSIWLDNLMSFPLHWLNLFGVDARDGTPFLSMDSVVDLLMLIAGIVILVLPLAALINYGKIKDAKLRILILTYWFMTALIMLGYTCGRLANANWRLSPIMAMSIVVSVAFLKWAVSQNAMQRVVSVLMIPVVFVALINAAGILKMPAMQYKNAVLYQLADALEENGLDYGYATFWRANSITVVSDSRVECRSVNVTETGVTPYEYQSCRSWFDDQPNQEEYFLLLTKDEYDIFKASTSPLVEKEYEEIPAHGYYILVFNENVIVR